MKPILLSVNDYADYDGVRLRRDYLRSLRRAGGLPLAVPHDSEENDADALARAYLAVAGGLLLSGGDDIQPRLFGQTPRLELECYPGRDALELALCRAALEAGLPIFGVCRGMQVINVALGGTLYQDLDLDFQPGANAMHRFDVADRYRTHHDISVTDPDLAKLLGRQTRVNSHHHQAVDALAPGLQAAAHSADGLCEALIMPGYPLLAVQWHPECLDGGQVLFDRFVELCR